ncbi:THUMP domain-containing protein 2 isoform X2 [Choloepus didactylus]|uniref:THUMP domain-containing protein 2 isoform X2 n=1 Tax=Choloepus didactylus TaxID=27675 RepID=UPI00189E5FC0|nr:THUMP domain-containing protein 2 isoform X2 [Choloepus didactylus]
MSGAPVDAGPEPLPAGGARFFCTAGRGLEPFLMREVRVRLAATQVECISGKVFFTTCSDLNMLMKLKSAERLFLLIKKQFPLTVSSVSKGKIFNEMQRLVNDDPGSWSNAISIWKNLHELDAKREELSQGDSNPLKRKAGENEIIMAKKFKTEQMQDIPENGECRLEKQVEEETLEQKDCIDQRGDFQEEFQSDAEKAIDTHNQCDLTFRVSCRCSGAIGRTFTAQIFIHLNDVYSIVGIPVFRVPLASRAYIRTAGLRSTVAWALASLAEIKAGAFVLDPMCGFGTILLEAAKEWPDVYYVGADVSDSQLLGACDNLKASGLKDKIELLKVSVIELPLPSESVDIIISDIPFGKKFKLGKDIKNILQEMERVLRVGGTVVLLLSEDHYWHIRDCEESSFPLDSKSSHTDELGISKSWNPEEKKGLSEKCSDKMPLFGTLVPVECYKVSLGKTGAFICKYKKSHSSGL